MGTVSKTDVSLRGRKQRGVPGNTRVAFADITLSSSYATGGDALPSAASLGLKEILFIYTDGPFVNTAGTSCVPVRPRLSTNKIQAYRYDGSSAGKANLEEVANGVDLSAYSGRLRFEGLPLS